MRGRKPKPTALQQAEGDPSKRGVHKLAEKLAAEPKASKGLPGCPRHLRGRARYAWNFWSEELAAMNLDRRPDAMALEGACVAYETAVYAYETLEKQGRLIAKRKMVTKRVLDPATNAMVETSELVVVDVKTHPAVIVQRAAWMQLRAFCSEFGFSPVSRQRVAVEKKDDGLEDLAALLSRPREPKAPVVVVQ